ncbi:TAFII28-domain-containing protein [Pluteus cervinus]|uniref:TAFII28-domain-containing protein n=1 Tax=Pluteus cervinus TaxID=181527 RepID=A0ACD3AEU9_9AGAR|nr:TAFII28-domain-containing protein [Pluteus cervinus]
MPSGSTAGTSAGSPAAIGEIKAASASPVIPAISSPLTPTASQGTPITAASIPQPPTTGYTTQPSSSQSPILPIPVSTLLNASSTFGNTASTLDTTGLLTFSSGTSGLVGRGTPLGTRPSGIDEDGEGEDELLPAMADDDYSAQQSWQSQSKDNLKVLMDNFSPAQYERFEAYRRHALPKQAVRKVIQQTTGQQVSQPVAQIVAGFAKVFVGEIVERARAVQARRRERGPLTPDHLREAYRLYQDETGRVGSARPIRSKRLFLR